MSTISAGTTSTTTLVHSGDTTGSLVFKTNDTGSGGTTAVTINTSQAIGVGSTPSYGTSGQFLTSSGSGSAPTWTTAASSQWTTSGSNIYYTTGQVGIGTSSPGYTLHVYKAGDGQTPVQFQTGNANGFLYFYNDSNGWSLDSAGDFRIVTSRTASGSPTRLYIDTNGAVLISAARASARALVDIPTVAGSSSVCLGISRGGDAGTMVNFYSTNSSTTVIGSIGNSGNTNTTYNTSSDYRLKDEVTPMSGALNKVSALRPVTWKWKSTGADGQGFVAHELAEVIPDCVTGEKDAVDADGNPVYQGVDTSYLVATLTKAIQELKAINDQQAETINALTARLVALESKA